MTRDEIEAFIDQWPIIPGMIDALALRIILEALDATREVPGAVVEMGCHVGTTSLYLQRYLDAYAPHKTLHVVDSFRGLPARTLSDRGDPGPYVEGACFGTRDQFTAHFAEAGLRLPVIHEGWFAEITDYPRPISFSFFDGDLYSSIMTSFEKVWPRLLVGGRIVVHDLDLVGCGSRWACQDFGQPWTEEYGCATLVKTA